MMLIMVSMTAGADVKVLYGKTGNDTFTGGKISATQEVQKDGQVAVTFTIKPDNGYTFTYTKTSLVIVSVYDPSSKPSTRADEIKVSEPLSVKGTEGTIRYPNSGEYTVTVDPNLGVWVQTVVFTESGAKLDPDYSGTYYIANKIWNGDHDQATEVGYEDYYYSSSKPDKNWYLVPARNPHQANKEDAFYSSDSYATSGDPEKPFLTTNRTNRDNNSIWVITKTGNKYLIKHFLTGKYLKYEPPVSANLNRRSVHLEAVEGNTPPTANEFLFTITPKTENSISGYNIKPTKPNGTDAAGVLNPAGDNWPYYYAHIQNKGIWCTGIVGYYDKTGGGSLWVFEDVNIYKYKPYFSLNSDNQIVITYPENYDDIYYTTDGSEPPTSGNEHKYTVPFNPPADATSIKAVAVKDGVASPVAIYSLPFFPGSTHKYIIQGKSCKYYNMIPNLSVDANTKNVSTLNVPSTTMAWHFEYAADEDGQYYYIVSETENSEKWYMYYTNDNNPDKHIYLKNTKDNSDNYKFNIDANPSGGYNLIPKGQANAIYKSDPGKNDAGLQPIRYNGNINDAISRWDIIPYSKTNLPMWETSPFDVSTDDVTNYYTITPLSKNTDDDRRPLIINSSGVVNSENVPEGLDSRKTMWVIKKVAAFDETDNPTGDDSELLDFYTIQNAYTGELIYYNGNGNGDGRYQQTPTFQMGMPSVTGADETWSHFVIVQTASKYNIIPRIFVDNVKAINRTSTPHYGFNCLNRSGGDDILGTFYDDGDGSRWTFAEQTNVKCMNPVFTEETDGSITITSVTNAAVIRYTDNGNDPDADSEVYTTKSNTSAQRVIKAIAIIGTDSNTASDVVTLLNKPVITLTEGGNPVTSETYTYDGIAKEPVVSEVSIGETSATAGTDYETVETTDYSNNTNASTDVVKAKVTLRDKASRIFVWHAEKEFNINPKEVVLTWDPDDSGQTTFTYSGLAQAPTVTATGLISPDKCTVTVTVTADEGSSLTNDEAINYGNYIATASPLENTNYKLPDAKTRAFTITRAPVTVTADDKTKGYGDSEPEWTATVTGMMNNEDPSLIVYTVSRESGNENGTYEIIPSGDAEQGNYTVTYVNGTLTISAIKPLNKDDAGTPADGITISVTYNGAAYQVVVTHKKVDEDYELVEGTDYTWTVASNTDQNHPEYDVVTVTGHGNYTGEAKAIYIRLTFYDTTPNNDTDGPETAAAYYATQNLQLSGGIEAWYVTNLENNTLTFEKVKVVEGENETSYLPENQPVLLFGNPSSTGFMLKPYIGTTMDIPATGEEGANILKVVTVDAGTAVSLGEVYVFSIGEFVLTMAGTLKKGKVYLDNPSYNSSSLSRGTLSASRGERTGINDVRLSKTNDQFNEEWYALDGQKFNKKPTRKGIYLQNGRKVVIK